MASNGWRYWSITRMRSVPVGVCASTLSLGHYLRPEGKAGQSRDMQGRRGKEGSLSAE